MKKFAVAPLLFFALVLLVGTQATYAKGKKATLAASPAEFRGSCPGVITFTGSITVDKAGIIKYIFTRSDGAIDTITKSLFFKGPGTKKVTETWTLGGTQLPYYKGWEAIKVIAPNGVMSNQATFELKCNPSLNSAISAHGNTDWHIDTANEFLFGVDMSGVLTAPNHAPLDWSKQHMHVGLTNTAKYYYDKTKIPAGEDTNGTSGIDRTMLFFYAGHGNPTLWNTLGDNASQADMLLANIKDRGMLRYYWQCSCEVFAHGPRDPSACVGSSSMEYRCPQNFNGSADSYDMRNIFERWGHVLTPDLRMACGMSTSAYCHENNVDSVWNDYNNLGMSVAQSFINGFSGWDVVPLCITMGGSNIANTPLYKDTTFTNQPNTSGSTYYHIMYLSGVQSKKIPIKIPVKLPKFYVVAADIPIKLKSLAHPTSFSHAAFAGGKAFLRIDSVSGAVYLASELRAPVVEPAIEESEYLARSAAFVREMGWESKELGTPTVTRLNTASMPVGGKAKDITRGQGAVLVTYPRQIEVDGNLIEVLGEGGKVNILMSNGGRLLNASRVWRKIEGASADVMLKTFEEAEAEALKKLSTPEAYKLDQWRWGYKEPAGNVEVKELKVVYQFAFMPKNSNELLKYPPRLIEISAEKN
jgi:hypothetical protein